jgi:hypothetical protein
MRPQRRKPHPDIRNPTPRSACPAGIIAGQAHPPLARSRHPLGCRAPRRHRGADRLDHHRHPVPHPHPHPHHLALKLEHGEISSFRLHPAAEGKPGKTISTYTEALAWLVAAHVVSRTRHAGWVERRSQVCVQAKSRRLTVGTVRIAGRSHIAITEASVPARRRSA